MTYTENLKKNNLFLVLNFQKKKFHNLIFKKQNFIFFDQKNLNYYKYQNAFLIKNTYNFMLYNLGTYNSFVEERFKNKFFRALIDRSVNFFLFYKILKFSKIKRFGLSSKRFFFKMINVLKKNYIINYIILLKKFISKLTTFEIENLEYITRKKNFNYFLRNNSLINNFSVYFNLLRQFFFFEIILLNFSNFFIKKKITYIQFLNSSKYELVFVNYKKNNLDLKRKIVHTKINDYFLTFNILLNKKFNFIKKKYENINELFIYNKSIIYLNDFYKINYLIEYKKKDLFFNNFNFNNNKVNFLKNSFSNFIKFHKFNFLKDKNFSFITENYYSFYDKIQKLNNLKKKKKNNKYFKNQIFSDKNKFFFVNLNKFTSIVENKFKKFDFFLRNFNNFKNLRILNLIDNFLFFNNFFFEYHQVQLKKNKVKKKILSFYLNINKNFKLDNLDKEKIGLKAYYKKFFVKKKILIYFIHL